MALRCPTVLHVWPTILLINFFHPYVQQVQFSSWYLSPFGLCGTFKKCHFAPSLGQFSLFNFSLEGGAPHVLFWVRIMKRRVRTVAMPFLLSVLVLCLSKHCMLVQLLREKVAALVFWQLLLCDSWQRSSCHDTWVNSRNLYTSARIEEGIAIVLTRRIGPTFQEVCSRSP